MTATHELVVPKSIPMTLLINFLLIVSKISIVGYCPFVEPLRHSTKLFMSDNTRGDIKTSFINTYRTFSFPSYNKRQYAISIKPVKN
jgi:hypothetical protein